MGEAMRSKLLIVVMALLSAIGGFVLMGCGSAGSADTTEVSGVTSSSVATGEVLKIAYNEGFTGPMAVDAALADHGIQTALKQLGNQVLGHPIEYLKIDNGMDPVQAVDKARQLVESDKIKAHFGPIFAPAAAAVTDYLSKAGGIPEIGILGWASENLKTANKLSFIPQGLLSCSAYYFGKYAFEELGYKTVSAIYYEDTAAYEIQAGFQKGFEEAGGKILYCEYVPTDTMDFSSYLTSMPKSDCTLYWVFGPGAAPFIQQYHDYSVDVPLITPTPCNLTEGQMADLGDIALDILGIEYYTPELDNPINKKFVEDYRAQWAGEYPQTQSSAGWIAVNLFVEAVKKTNGDTSPEALKSALATISLDTPAGPYSFVEYQSAWVGKGNLYVMKTQMVGDRMTWVPIKTYEQVVFTDIR
jgi:branched-chain amino acid transport system substrate-binding protein